MKKLLLLTTALMITAALSAQIIHVPADQPTIQAGIDAATTGDTVLVAPGRYFENVLLYNKNITLASWYLISHNTEYITQTIIDGNQSGSVVYFGGLNLDSTALFCGFSLVNGSGDCGGGMVCSGASPVIQALRISNCDAIQSYYDGHGGGIFLSNSNACLMDMNIDSCKASLGAGIYMINSDILLNNVVIKDNNAFYEGGGIFCSNSNLTLNDVKVTRNSAEHNGGGLLCLSSNVNIAEKSNISQNNATFAGGIYLTQLSQLFFDPVNRGSVILNTADDCQDIFSTDPVDMVLDTFSVLIPSKFFARLPAGSTWDISHGMIQQVNADLYVSPAGDNSNSGQSPDQPLKTIHYAFCKILTDSLNPHTIYLNDGTYSTTSSGERFPLCPPDYITISGTSRQNTILDAEELKPVIKIFNNKCSSISSLMVTGGTNNTGGAGIFCVSSNLALQDLKISGNNGANGGGIASEGSTIIFQDIVIDSNSASNGGGCYLKNTHAECHAIDVKFNMATHIGGGILTVNSSLDFNNVLIENNYASKGGGIAATDTGTILAGTTIRYNQAEKGGGIYSEGAAILNFNPDNRCNIYLNKAENGADIYTETLLDIIVDTFTVVQPTVYHVSSIHQYTFDILHGKIQQVNTDCYVSPGGDNNNSGLTPDEPIKNISAAISKLQVDSVLYLTIHLMEGTYSLSSTEEAFPLTINPFIHLKGVDKHLVILDAESQPGVLVLNQNNTSILSDFTVKGAGNIQNSVYSCIKLSYSDCQLQNMNITDNEGYGINCYYSNPLLDNLGIINNGYSGIDLSYSNPLIKNSRISNNQRSGINCYHSDPVIKNLVITGNSSDIGGGGLYCRYSHPVVDSVIIENNIVTSGYYGTGGGIYCDNSSPKITNALIKGNTALKGGGIYATKNSIPVIQNIRIENNLAEYGGAFYANNSPAVIKASTIYGNTATLSGGGIYSYFSDIGLTDVTISGNSALEGAGVYLAAPSNPVLSNVSFTTNTASKDGGAVYCFYSNPILINVLISANSAINGGGIFSIIAQPVIINATISDNISSFGGALFSSRSSASSFVNSILWNNTPQEIYFSDINESGKITVYYSNIKGAQEGIITNNNAEIAWMEGNIDNDPSFIGDGDFPYALNSDSPCIDSGTPDTTALFLPLNDLLGNPRIFNDRIDMGVFEWNNLGSAEYTTPLSIAALCCYPNPFTTSTTLEYTLQQGGSVHLAIYNQMSKQVAVPVNEYKPAGVHKVSWNAAGLPAGIYYCRLQAGNQVYSGKMILMK